MGPIDKKGYDSLKVVGAANKFNQWMFETIAPFAKGDILEIGSGIGNISEFFIANNYNITLSDIDAFYLEILKTKFRSNSNVKGILSIDLQSAFFEQQYGHLMEKFDCIFYLNVLEHLENDRVAIQNSRFMLKPGGRLIVLVPAYSFLYSRMDKALNHYRRYTKKSMSNLLSNQKMEVINSFYFNALGIGAWYYGKVRRLETVPKKEMSTFNTIVPFAKLLDKIVLQRLGLSVISIAQK